MKKKDKIYIGEDAGMVGSAIVKKLLSEEFEIIAFTPHQEYKLSNQKVVQDFVGKKCQI